MSIPVGPISGGVRVGEVSSGSGWTLYRAEVARTFECGRCKARGKNGAKTSKNFAMGSNGEIICNGCYGLIRSGK